MKKRFITASEISAFAKHLWNEEREAGTIEKYLRTVRTFAAWLEGRSTTKEAAANWKESLRAAGYQPGTVNSMLSALNKFFTLMGWSDCRVRYLNVQRRLFRSTDRELTKPEYLQLLETAQNLGKTRLALLMETLCATGIRVSEVKYITVEAVRAGRADIALKGKIRTILIPGKLCRKLQKYANKQKTVSGEVFLTRNGRGLTRRQIWAEMKAICEKAGVAPSKVFPHNLRHLFARTFYHACRDVVKLADILGHSNIETTRIYLLSTGAEHIQQVEQLGLIS